MNLNNLFDTNKSIVQSLYEEAEGRGGDLPDNIFSQACEEYNMSEDDVMELMAYSTEHEFKRYSTGWTVIIK